MSEGITEKQAEKEEEDLFEIEDELNENLGEKEHDLESYGGAVDAMTKSTVEEDATKEATVDEVTQMKEEDGMSKTIESAALQTNESSSKVEASERETADQVDASLGLRKIIEELRASNSVLEKKNARLEKVRSKLAEERDDWKEKFQELEKTNKRDDEYGDTPRDGTDLANSPNEDLTPTQRLVTLGEKNYKLARKCKAAREELDNYKSQMQDAREMLLRQIVEDDPCTTAKNVPLGELCNLFIQKVSEDAGKGRDVSTHGVGDDSTFLTRSAARSHSAPVNALQITDLQKKIAELRAHNRMQTATIESMRQDIKDAEKQSEQVKSYASMCQTFSAKLSREKDFRTKAGKDLAKANDEIVRLSDHVKKLMVHLKHESTKKMKEHKRAQRLEREVEALTQRTGALSRKNTQRERVISELREGSKILEDQLRLMDKKYIELRSRLDWTRNHSKLQVKKMQKEANALRAKWALAGGLDLELLARQSKKKKGGKMSKQLQALIDTGASMQKKTSKDVPHSDDEHNKVKTSGESKRAASHGAASPARTTKRDEKTVTLPSFAASRPGSSYGERDKKKATDPTLPWSSKSIGALERDMKRHAAVAPASSSSSSSCESKKITKNIPFSRSTKRIPPAE